MGTADNAVGFNEVTHDRLVSVPLELRHIERKVWAALRGKPAEGAYGSTQRSVLSRVLGVVLLVGTSLGEGDRLQSNCVILH